MRKTIAVVLACSIAMPAFAQWTDGKGHPAPPSSDHGVVQDFSGQVIVTADDWESLWRSEAAVPRIRTTDTVAVGEKVSVLLFFANPGLDAQGVADIACDMRVTFPDGTVAHDVKDIACYHARLSGIAKSVYLASPRLDVHAEDSDPRGLWRVEFTMRDKVRGVTLPLSATFTLTDAKPAAK